MKPADPVQPLSLVVTAPQPPTLAQERLHAVPATPQAAPARMGLSPLDQLAIKALVSAHPAAAIENARELAQALVDAAQRFLPYELPTEVT